MSIPAFSPAGVLGGLSLNNLVNGNSKYNVLLGFSVSRVL